jgi:hypothetical protein
VRGLLHLFELVVPAFLFEEGLFCLHLLVDGAGEYFCEFFTDFVREDALVDLVEFL